MPQYIVRLFDAEGHATHSHTIVAASPDAIIRKVASLYRSRPLVEIRAGNSVVALLTAEEMSVINSSWCRPQRRGVGASRWTEHFSVRERPHRRRTRTGWTNERSSRKSRYFSSVAAIILRV
jgi:hypothetical protein